MRFWNIIKEDEPKMTTNTAQTVQTSWGWLLAIGIIFIILGILGLGMPFALTLAADLVVGWLLLIGGIISIISSFYSRNLGRFFMIFLSGVVFGIAGILLLTKPLVGVLTLTLILAAFFFIEGIFKVIYSLQIRPIQNWGWMLVSGIISLILAFLIWADFPGSVVITGLLVGFYLFFSGISMIMLSVASRGALKTT